MQHGSISQLWHLILCFCFILRLCLLRLHCIQWREIAEGSKSTDAELQEYDLAKASPSRCLTLYSWLNSFMSWAILNRVILLLKIKPVFSYLLCISLVWVFRRRKMLPGCFLLHCSPLTEITKVKLQSFPLCITDVKLLPSLSLSFCAGRPSTALWTRAPHPKVAYPAPTITLYWGCMIPKMTSHSEKQVALALIFCVALALLSHLVLFVSLF